MKTYKVQYKILSDWMILDLETSVNVEIFEGWLPLGGVVIDDRQNYKRYLQAMVKHG